MSTQASDTSPQARSSGYLLPLELLTLLQTGKAPAIPVALFDSAYWRRIIDFDALVSEGMVSPEHRALFEYADTAQEVWQSIERRGLRAHA